MNDEKMIGLMKMLQEVAKGNATMEMSEFPNPFDMNDDKVKISAGKISKDLLTKYRKYSKKADVLTDEVDLKRKELVMEMQRRMEEMFQERTDILNDTKSDLWAEACKELNLSVDESLSINTSTGEITRHISKNENGKPDLKVVPFPKDNESSHTH